MNNPKAMPRRVAPSNPHAVSAGSHRLPGPCCIEKPSMKITTIISKVDSMPRSEVYDKRDNGKNTVGINL